VEEEERAGAYSYINNGTVKGAANMESLDNQYGYL